jgi:hypothetical protein
MVGFIPIGPLATTRYQCTSYIQDFVFIIVMVTGVVRCRYENNKGVIATSPLLICIEFGLLIA